MTFRELISYLGFVAVAQNLVVPFRIEFPVFPENSTAGEKKRFKPQDCKTYAKKCRDRVYHRRLVREYENYGKD